MARPHLHVRHSRLFFSLNFHPFSDFGSSSDLMLYCEFFDKMYCRSLRSNKGLCGEVVVPPMIPRSSDVTFSWSHPTPFSTPPPPSPSLFYLLLPLVPTVMLALFSDIFFTGACQNNASFCNGELCGDDQGGISEDNLSMVFMIASSSFSL